ncbi:MAG: bifunctional 5,10-methylenetetrahydrofolate dehydrogenase/5,10-methenyltetrahydrofolate cyclohydrolase [Nitrososphaerales archaeon]
MPDTTVMYAEPLVTEMKAKISKQVGELKDDRGVSPKLVALLIGREPVSRTYVDLKRNDCAQVGILSEVRDLSSLPKEEAAEKLPRLLKELNSDPSVSAVIPQIPFDGRVKEEEVFSILSPDKDVDGLTPFRLGKLLRKEYSLESSLLPCTPKGVILLVKRYNVTVAGADVAIIGRSTLVGEPLRKMFQDLDATATCYHTRSKHMRERIKEADIVVAASGRPPEIYGISGFRVSRDLVKEGSVVIGVGVKKHEGTGKMLFDVDTKSLRGHCSFVTPNTGGVGAMTRAVLLENTLIAAKLQSRKS